MNWIEKGDASVAFSCSREKANVFLIGDSIRKGYCATVKEELKDIAEVFYVDENCRNTQFVISALKRWTAMFSDPTLVTLVHFNCGQWDVAHWNGYEHPLTSEGEYERNILAIIVLLRRFFPNAKIVFATTSRMNPNNCHLTAVNPRSNEEVDRYNEIAVKVAKAEGIAINDLNTFMKDWDSSYYTDLCHLTKDAFALLGKEVARKLKEFL